MIVTINTDASFHKEKRIGAYAFWAVSNEFKIQKSGVFKAKCKNSDDAEIKCILNALKVVLYAHTGITKVIINTDSLNAIAIITNDKKHLRKYRVNDYKNLRIHYHVLIHGQKNKCEIEFRHVKAHSNETTARSYVNDWCDTQAKQRLWAYINSQKQVIA